MQNIQEVAAEIQLDPALDVRASAPLRDAFLERRGAALVVDASRVEHMGAQCLQVLLAARQAWQHDQLELTIAPRSTAFDSSLVAFGAAGAFSQSGTAE